MDQFDEATGFESLYDSMWKCARNGKVKKASVARFVLHGIEECGKLEQEIQEGRYLPRNPHTFRLTYPKERPCSSIHIRDRVVQRSVNDLVIYPAMTRSFIWDNMACQKGKGTTKMMDRVDHLLHRYYINNGNSNEGWVWQFDFWGYYKNMRHDRARECFERHLDKKTVDNAERWLQKQYPYPVGYEPGSQMVQILGVSMPDRFDHNMKENLRAKIYPRYMDDGFVVDRDREFLEMCWWEQETELAKLNLRFHPEKTKIFPLSEGIKFLGFTFFLTDTGKVVRIINPQNVKHERKKLVRMAQLVKRGIRTKEKYWECYGAWRAHAELGNSYNLLKRMDKYAAKVLKEAINENN